jgi:hypothetical protein
MGCGELNIGLLVRYTSESPKAHGGLLDVRQSAKMKAMTNRSLTEVADLNIRSIIDEIALEVAEANESEDDLSTRISDNTMEHIIRLREEHAFSEEELDRIASAIVRGVLKRLNQIAESGGQIGNA